MALVAGGAGFVSSYVCKALLAKGVKVVCVENWQNGVQENITDIADNKNFFLLEQDIIRPLTGILKLRYVLHFAGIEACLNREDISMEDVEANSHGIKNLLDLAVEKNARFLLASTLVLDETNRFAEAITNEYSQKKRLDVRIVRLGDVYGPKMLLLKSNPIAQLLKQTIYKEPLLPTHSTQKDIFPIYIDDVVEGVEKSLFSSGTKGAIITLAGSKTSLFAFAQDLQEPRIAKTLEWFGKHKANTPVQVEEKKKDEFWKEGQGEKKKNNTFGNFRTLQPILVFIFLLTAWFIVLPFVALLAGGLGLKLAHDGALLADTKKVQTWSSNARFLLAMAENGFTQMARSIPGVKNEASRLADSAAALGRLGGILESTSLVTEKTRVFASSIFKNEEFPLDEESSELSINLRYLEKQLAFFETDTEDVVKLPWLVNAMPGKEELVSLRRVVGTAGDLVAILPELLGSKGKKTYLILFQNNMELRPTGGFIGSFALLTFDKGRLVNTEVQDVYSADGQLKGHVEPPKPIKEYMGQKAWFLRDSNWSPDFPTSAQKAAWFLEKETGQKVNGVVAIDLQFVKNLVDKTGKIEVADFNQTVDGSNLYEITQRQVEENFFPGSRAKKDFLTALSRSLLARFTQDSSGYLLPAGRVAFSALEERHMAVWTDNHKTNEIFRHNGWDGAIEKVACNKTCVADYLQVVDANLGINKSNYFLDRAYSMEITVGDGRISHKLAISYNNKSQAGGWPGGDYKNYLRIFAPFESKPVLATIINPKTGESAELNIDEEQEQGKAVFGIPLTVPAGEARQIVVLWDVLASPAGGLSQSENAKEMVFLWQKQAGTDSDPVSLRVNIPSGTGIQAIPNPSLTTASSTSYNTTLSRDLLINLTWQPKH